MSHVPAPAVDLTIHIRYPLPQLSHEHREFGIESVAALVHEEVTAFANDPAELAELIESGRSTVDFEFEIDAPDHEFEGGEVRDEPVRDPFGRVGPAPREFHALGEA